MDPREEGGATAGEVGVRTVRVQAGGGEEGPGAAGDLLAVQELASHGADLTLRYHPTEKIPDPVEPITLPRLIEKLCDNGWIERRGDENDRRVNRLYLRKAARPLLGKLAGLRSELTATALDGINPADAHRLLDQLDLIKENVRSAIQNSAIDTPRKEQRYG